jgi:hypothetical protein
VIVNLGAELDPELVPVLGDGPGPPAVFDVDELLQAAVNTSIAALAVSTVRRLCPLCAMASSPTSWSWGCARLMSKALKECRPTESDAQHILSSGE